MMEKTFKIKKLLKLTNLTVSNSVTTNLVCHWFVYLAQNCQNCKFRGLAMEYIVIMQDCHRKLQQE